MKSVFGIKFKLVQIAAGALALLLAASCSNNAALTGADQAMDSQRQSSAFRVSTRISVTARVAKSTTSTSVTFSSSGTTLSQGTLFFTDGTSTSRSLSGYKGTVSASKTNLWYCRVRLGTGDYWYFDKTGDYWYFDRSGTWKPSSTTATARSTSRSGGRQSGDSAEVTVSSLILTTADDLISVTFEDGQVSASSTSGLASISACYSNRDYQQVELNGEQDSAELTAGTDCLCYVLVTGDGEWWFFDAEGNHLPNGLFEQYTKDGADSGKSRRQGKGRD